MKTVTFPLLNLNLKISDVAFSIFGVEIYWYAIMIVTAMVVALLVLKLREKYFDIKFSDIIDLAIYVIPISIISARIYYILFSLNDYIARPISIFEFRSGGLAIYGGIIGGLITCYIFCKKRKINFIDLLDYIVPSLAIGQSIGRWGNFFNVEAYGTQTNLPWRMGIYEFGEYIEVHPTFLYESICTLILFIILINIKNRKFSGQSVCVYLIGYGFVRMLIEGLRTDSLMLGNIRISQVLSLIILIFGITIYFRKIYQKKMSQNLKNCHKAKDKNKK